MTIILPDGRNPKQFTATCGIYLIKQLSTGRTYVGSSSEIEKRLYLHLVTLRCGTHHSQYLQHVWDRSEESDFAFYLVETCPVEDLLDREQVYMDSFKPEFNMQLTAHMSRGWNHSPETRLKMSISAQIVAADPLERQRRSDRAKRQWQEGKLGRKVSVT